MKPAGRAAVLSLVAGAVALVLPGCTPSPAPSASPPTTTSTSNRSSAEPAPAAHPDAFAGPVRGVTISTHGSGADWAQVEPMRRTVGEIAALGANWVAIHPYAGIRADGTVRARRMGTPLHAAHVQEPIRIAHEAGLKILIKPHLAYWGSPFRWRGEIRFDDPEAADRFWETYSEWIVGVAELAAEADGFAIGTELDGMVAPEHADRWLALIERVRSATGADLTYAANWTDYDRFPHWERLDAVGIQAYFPIVEEPDPTEAELAAGWERRMAELRAFSAEAGRPVLFTELGYNRSPWAAVRPWEHRPDEQAAPIGQQRCMRAALAAIEAEPAVRGALLWKWFPAPHQVGRDFQLATDGMRSTIRAAWTRPADGVTTSR